MHGVDGNENVREDRPLWLPAPLAFTRERRLLRKPRHWTLFGLSTLIGFTPMLIGIHYGMSAVASVISGSILPWWGVGLGAVLLIVCLAGIVLTAYAITEVDQRGLIMSLVFAFLAWPGVATMGFILTYVAPTTPVDAQLCNQALASEQDHCIWN